MNKINRKIVKEKAKEIMKDNMWNIWKPILIILGISFVVSTIINLFFVSSVDCSELYPFNIARVSGMTCTTTNIYGSLIETLFSIATIVLSAGYALYLLNIVRKKEFNVKNNLFKFFKQNLGVCIATGLLVGLFTALWSLLLIIPGIIAALSYSMSYYLLADGKNDALETIRESKKMMVGHKWEFFVFNLSFIGWILLSIFTLGIACIYVIPYMSIAQVVYYDELKSIQ